MKLAGLDEILAGEPAFRRTQALKAIFTDLIDDWDKATVLPMALREELNRKFPLAIKVNSVIDEDDGAVKAMVAFPDGMGVEAVLIRTHRKSRGPKQRPRNTVCVSSQVGCPVGCGFCATGALKYRRDLTHWEMIQQVLFFQRMLKNEEPEGRVDNVVFMGMGEPLLNYEALMRAIRVINDPEGLGIGARHIAVSTVGVVPGIRRLAGEDLQLHLAVSLHAADDVSRRKLVPLARKHTLREVIGAAAAYADRSGRKIMYEYVMLAGVNDSADQADALASQIGGTLCMVNLIPFNPWEGAGDFKPSNGETLRRFADRLKFRGIEVAIRRSRGARVAGACGQLAGVKSAEQHGVVHPDSPASQKGAAKPGAPSGKATGNKAAGGKVAGGKTAGGKTATGRTSTTRGAGSKARSTGPGGRGAGDGRSGRKGSTSR